MADQGGRHSDMITQLLRRMTSSLHDTDAKGDVFCGNPPPPGVEH